MCASIASSRSGRKRSGHAFQPDPPIPEQRRQINENFKHIINILTKVPTIQDPNDQSQQKSQSLKEYETNFQKYATKISDSVHKLFCDTWRSMRTSHKAGNSDSEEILKNILQEEFTDFSINLNNLREAQISYLYKIVQENGETPNNSLYLNTQKFINDLFELFSEDLFEILRKSNEFKDKEFIKAVKVNLTKELTSISNNYSTNIIKLFNLYDELAEPENKDPDIDNDALIDFFNDHLDPQYDGFKNSSILIHDFRKSIFSFLLHMIEYTSDYRDDGDKENEEEEIEEEEESDDLSSLFYDFLDALKELRGFLVKANEKKAEYGDEDDEVADWERLKLDDYIPLLTDEISFESELVLSNLIQYSQLASSLKNDETFDSIYSVIFNFIDERYSENDTTLKATDVSSVYLNYIKNSPRMDQKQIDLLENMLIRQIEQSSSKLENKRSKQLKLLSAPTKKNVDYYVSDAKRLNEEIQSLSTELNQAIFQAREGTFLCRSTKLTETSPNYASMSGQDEEVDPSEQDVFLSYDDEEGQATQNHLIALLDLNQQAYSQVEEETPDQASTKSSRKKRQSFADSSSVYSSGNVSTLSKRSSGASTITMTKAQMSKKLQYMDEPTRAQVNALDNAITATYLQRIASMRGYLVGTIRLGQYGEAKRINDIINKNCVNYQNHLSEARNRASQNLDIQQMQATESQTQEAQVRANDDVEVCIIDSFKTYLERLIRNYQLNLEEIKTECDEDCRNAETSFYNNSINLTNDIHIPQGELLEKQRLIAFKKEETRKVDQLFRDQEQNIRDLVKKNDYNRANIEKEKLDRMKKEDLKNRKKQVDKEFNAKREKLLNDQRKEMQMLEDKFNKKCQDIRDHAKQEEQYQLSTFISIVKSTISKHFSFAVKILQLDKNQKRIMQLKLEKAARSLFKKSDLTEMETIPLSEKEKAPTTKSTK